MWPKPAAATLERSLTLESHSFARRWVRERQSFGVKIQAVGLGAIESVALDGVAQPVWVSTMHAQLMGPARQRPENHAAVSFMLINGHGRFAMQSIDNLAWTVAGVGAQGQAYSSFVCFNGSLKLCDVAFFYAVFLELALQVEVRFHAECHNK